MNATEAVLTQQKLFRELHAYKESELRDTKLDWSLLPFDALEEVVKAFEVGRTKHPGKADYSQGARSYRELAAGLLRHFSAWRQGEDMDADGFHHLAGVAARCLMIIYLSKHDFPTLDDRK